MKNLLGVLIIAMLLSTAANAADLGKPGTGTYSLPGVTSSDRWNGPFIGGHVGYVWRKHDVTYKEQAYCDNDTHMENGTCYPDYKPCLSKAETCLPQLGDPDDSLYHAATVIPFEFNPEGLLGGATIGINWKFPNSVAVLGVFGDYSFANNETDKDSYLMAGRAGALLTPDVLVYGLVGYGWQNVDYPDGNRHTFEHWVAGGGVEKSLSQNLSISLEGQHWFENAAMNDKRSDIRVLGRLNWRIGK